MDCPVGKHYDIAWAMEAYAEFEESYPRGCKIFRMLQDPPEGYEAALLSAHPQKWERYKKIVKKLDPILEAAGDEALTDPRYLAPLQKELAAIILEVTTIRLFSGVSH